MTGHVFISHGSDNRVEADELAAFIEARGVPIWIAPRDVRPGMDYSEQLQEAIEGCAAFVVLVTQMANSSPYVRAETEMAFSNAKPIFPVRLSDIKPASGLAFFLKIRHWTDAYGPGRDASLERLLRELQALTGAPAEAAPAPPLPPSPAPAQPARSDDEELLAAAIGTNADYFLGRWRAMDEKKTIFSWNWAACFLNLFWFAFRKMWVPLVGLILASFSLSALELIGDNMAKVEWGLFIGMSFVTGYLGNHWYRQQTRKLVAEVAGLDRAAALDQLKRRGGISQKGLFITIGVVFLLVALTAVLAVKQAAEQLKAQQAAAAPAPAAPAETGPPALDLAYLVGRWTDDGDCNNAYEFTADGRFVAADGAAAEWRLEGNELIATGPGGSASMRIAPIDRNTMTVTNAAGQSSNPIRC